MDEKKRITIWILRKMALHRYWGGKHPHHTPCENIWKKSVPSHKIKEVKKVFKKLVKKSFIKGYPTSGRIDCYLNMEKREEIFELIKDYLQTKFKI